MRNFLKDMWTVLKGHGAEVTADDLVSFPWPHKIPPACIDRDNLAGYQRHLYLGSEFCRRGCGHRDAHYKPEAVPTEGV